MFDFDYDLDSMAYLMQYARDLKEVEPWKSAVSKELDLAPDLTHEQLRGYLLLYCFCAISTDAEIQSTSGLLLSQLGVCLLSCVSRKRVE